MPSRIEEQGPQDRSSAVKQEINGLFEARTFIRYGPSPAIS